MLVFRAEKEAAFKAQERGVWDMASDRLNFIKRVK
jgi:hypothetical protein